MQANQINDNIIFEWQKLLGTFNQLINVFNFNATTDIVALYTLGEEETYFVTTHPCSPLVNVGLMTPPRNSGNGEDWLRVPTSASATANPF